MANKKSALDERREEADYKSRLIGVKMTAKDGESLNAVVFTTKTLYSAFPRHDFLRIDFGEEIAGRIEIQTRDYLIQLTGDRLKPIFDQIVLNRIYTISESAKEITEIQSAVRKIIIAKIKEE